MSDIVRLILILLLVAVFIWLLIDFIVSWAKDKKIVRNSRSMRAAGPSAAVNSAAATATKPKAAPVERPRKAATSSKPDDLTKIEGIGPKIAELLNNDGIRTFATLAAANIPRLRKILDDAGSRFQMHDPASWPEQAGLAAKGDWKALETLQDSLNGGR